MEGLLAESRQRIKKLDEQIKANQKAKSDFAKKEQEQYREWMRENRRNKNPRNKNKGPPIYHHYEYKDFDGNKIDMKSLLE